MVAVMMTPQIPKHCGTLERPPSPDTLYVRRQPIQKKLYTSENQIREYTSNILNECCD